MARFYYDVVDDYDADDKTLFRVMIIDNDKESAYKSIRKVIPERYQLVELFEVMERKQNG